MVSSYLFGLFSTGNIFAFRWSMKNILTNQFSVKVQMKKIEAASIYSLPCLLVNIPFLIYFRANSCYREMAVV
jgi:hypothetical protein